MQRLRGREIDKVIGGDENLSWLCTTLDVFSLPWTPLEELIC